MLTRNKVTPLFNQSRGNILLPALFHLQLINPIWPDAQLYDAMLFVAAATAVVWIHRRAMFSGATAVIEVIPERSGTQQPGLFMNGRGEGDEIPVKPARHGAQRAQAYSTVRSARAAITRWLYRDIGGRSRPFMNSLR